MGVGERPTLAAVRPRGAQPDTEGELDSNLMHASTEMVINENFTFEGHCSFER
jgi:hypothetical protein